MNAEILEASAERHAVMPTVAFRLRVTHESPLLGALLRAQVRIGAPQRRYSPEETEALSEIFGEPARWKETMRSLQWTTVAITLPAFEQDVEVALKLTATYDFQVGPARYLAALREGVVPLTFLFSGHLFSSDGGALSVTPIPWDREATFPLPVETLRQAMDACFGGEAWIRMSRDTFDEMARFKRQQGLVSWDDAMRALLPVAGGVS